jgi:hypothetical protein
VTSDLAFQPEWADDIEEALGEESGKTQAKSFVINILPPTH